MVTLHGPRKRKRAPVIGHYQQDEAWAPSRKDLRGL